MPAVFVGVGSNIRPRREICSALDRLVRAFGPLSVSPAYRTEAMGFRGPDFINLVVGFETELGIETIIEELRAIERLRASPSIRKPFGSRTIDLDLLLYGNACIQTEAFVVPRADIRKFAYVLWPLADMAPGALHPQAGQTYQALREAFREQQSLRQIAFFWRGKKLPVVQTAITPVLQAFSSLT